MRFLVILLYLITLPAISQDIRTKHFNLEENLAIQGYDVVSYFDGKPKKGNSKIHLTHEGVKYYFSSEKNRIKFKANPDSYEPQYGGWCAYAIGNSAEKVRVDPETFTIIDGKLYLFYNFFFTNTLESWKEDQQNLLKKSIDNWNKIIQN